MLLEHMKNCTELAREKYDEACLQIVNKLNNTVYIFGQYKECEGCDYQKIATLPPISNQTMLVMSNFTSEMYYTTDQSDNPMCRWTQEMYEHYEFGWNITNPCSKLYVKQPADNPYLPILSAFIILFFFGTFWYMFKCIYKCTRNYDVWKRYVFWNSELQNDLGSTEGSSLMIEKHPPIRKHPNRIKSLDIFRGLCIMVMIFVNYGGGQYWFFKHSPWNGLTVADLVFPWFLWLMGFSISVSFNNKLRNAVPRRHLVVQVIRRALVLIFIGLMLNSHCKHVKLEELRLPGVLQRIGITYLYVGLLEALFSKRLYDESAFGRLACVQDIIIAWKQWLAVLTILIIHIVLTFGVDVPGCGKGYLGPGGLHDFGKHENCTGGMSGYLDRLILHDHMYKKASCHALYENKEFYDPEGILGTFTSVFTVYLGVQAGRTLNTYSNVKAKMLRWMIWSIVSVVIGGCLAINDFIPINKNLWSLSYTLVTAGMAFFLQGNLFIIVDIMRKWGGRPFFYPGMNPLVLYAGHELFKNTFPFAWTPVNKTHAAYLSMNLWGTFLWVAIAIFMYKRNIFISI